MKNCIIFGATGSIGQHLVSTLNDKFKIIKIGRNEDEIFYDFNTPALTDKLLLSLPDEIKLVIFAQGMNPSMGFNEINQSHFNQMLNLNIIGPTLILQKIKHKLAKNSIVLFFSSIAAQKGSYDPSYAASKSAINGLVQTLANNLTTVRFNTVSLGLVEGSRVHRGMTADFVEKHQSKMFNNQLIQQKNISAVVQLLIDNENFNRATINLDGGFKL